MNQYSTIVRREGTDVYALVMWSGVDYDKIFNQFTSAISQWIRTTKEGTTAWENNHREFTVADLAQYHLSYGDITNPLYQILQQHDINNLIIDLFTVTMQHSDWFMDDNLAVNS